MIASIFGNRSYSWLVKDIQNLLVEVGAVKGNDHRILLRKSSLDEHGSKGLRSGKLQHDEDDDWD